MPTLRAGAPLRWVSTVLIGFGLWVCAVGCGDDEPEESYYCCVALSLCDKCGCGSNQSAASSGDDQRCLQFINEGDWECLGWTEVDARNSCK